MFLMTLLLMLVSDRLTCSDLTVLLAVSDGEPV
jgi:hypothetical protein